MNVSFLRYSSSTDKRQWRHSKQRTACSRLKEKHVVSVYFTRLWTFSCAFRKNIPSRFPFQPEPRNCLIISPWHLSRLHPVPLVCLCVVEGCQRPLLVDRKIHVLNSKKSSLLAQHSGTNQELLARTKSPVKRGPFSSRFHVYHISGRDR